MCATRLPHGGDSADPESRLARTPRRPAHGAIYGALVIGVLFVCLLASVLTGWAPAQTADDAVVDSLNSLVSAVPWLPAVLQRVTYLGGSGVAWILLSVAFVWLAIRRERVLAIYVVVTGLGAAVLTTGIKALVERARPTVDSPVIATSGLSFPSGHSLGSTVTYGVLLLVFLPTVRSRFHKPVVIAFAGMVVAIGVTRVGLGVHYPSDVLGGWLLGVLWLLVTAIAFRRWHETAGLGDPPLLEGLEPEEQRNLLPAPVHDSPLPAGWHSATNLVVAAVLIWGAIVGLGLLITDKLAVVRDWDASAAEWFANTRTESLTDIFFTISRVGDTGSIVLLLIVAVPLGAALTRRWRPPLFLLVAVGGELLLFLAASAVVGRHRPTVEQLTPDMPPTSSFPSGHVAATTAAYGAVALLVGAWSRARSRYGAVVLAVLLVLSVSVARLYLGAHYLTDVLTSVVYVCAWLAVCWFVIRPGEHPAPGEPVGEGEGGKASEE
ncbi:phosphatase PAP2 family protein (plasmid) [Rhodococcus opacus]|uniref:phosphatase PAP2 family protein n=1 Tax=Rhodococcus opacus TaxID=37919 RepID=UPI0034D37169